MVALMGNPNVGKSTVFNEITGMHQHTGNWTGKTVDLARGEYYYKYINYEIVDLPGTYSLLSSSEEERIARDFLCFSEYDCVICVVDSTSLQRNLNLVFQVMEVTDKVVILLNLADEAKKMNISIDAQKLSEILGVPVITATAKSGRGINNLLEQIHLICTGLSTHKPINTIYPTPIETAVKYVSRGIGEAIPFCRKKRFFALRLLENDDSFNISFKKKYGENILGDSPIYLKLLKGREILKRSNLCDDNYIESITCEINNRSNRIVKETVLSLPSKKEKIENKVDKILLGKYTSVPIMLLIFGIVLWITIVGSNYPSDFLRSIFGEFENNLAEYLLRIGVSQQIVSLFVGGVLKVLLWVVAVMLPPMAIFFPLFAILEDYGFLPRIAFNLDRSFEKCGACGKQALTICMGYGCNAVGVTGCRIIDSPRERLVAIITNSLTPCNGRLPPPTLWQLLWLKIAKISSK